MDSIDRLYLALRNVQGIADALDRLAHDANRDPVHWKRLRSTSFAAEKQSVELATRIAGETNGKRNLLLLKTPKIPGVDYSPQGFKALHEALTTAASAAIDCAGGSTGDTKDRMNRIEGSMLKQGRLLTDHAALEFPPTTKGKVKAKKT